MCRINQNSDAPRPTAGRDRVDRQNQRTFRRNVVDHRDTRARADRLGDPFDELIGIEARIGHLHDANLRSPLARHEGDDPRRRAIGVVGQEHLVARLEPEGSQDGVHAGRRVVYEHDVVAAGADEGRDVRCRTPKPRRLGRWNPGQTGDVAEQDLRRRALNLIANRLLRRQDPPRRHPDGAVIQVRHVRIERPVREHRFSEGCHWLQTAVTEVRVRLGTDAPDTKVLTDPMDGGARRRALPTKRQCAPNS